MRGERGSAVLLLPAGFVALLVLAAIAVDQSRLFAARRQLLDVAASAANDAVAASLDESAYRRGEGAALAAVRASSEVRASLAAHGLADRVRSQVSLREGPAGPEVIVRLESDEPTVFARLAPGGYGTTAIRVTASATFVIF
ncbi:MAG: hypothetical protein QOJ19_1661 [Acidimicrobiia bacterium]|jgi:hypothetical protein|nr:hypothetical protein [Acidimicrobiia bacterium]